MTLGINVTSNEPETIFTPKPGRRMFPEYEQAKMLSDELWDKLSNMEVTDPVYLRTMTKYNEAEAMVQHIYRTTIGLGR